MMTRPSFRSATACWLVGCLVALSGERIVSADDLLRWHLAPGQQYVLQSVANTQRRVGEVETSDRLELEFGWSVVAVDEAELATVEQVLRRVKQTVAVEDGVTMSYDSAATGEPVAEATDLAQFWKPRLNRLHRFQLSPQGKLTLLPSTAATVADDSDEGKTAILMSDSELSLGPNAYLEFPAGELVPGFQWVQKQDLELPIVPPRWQMSSTYTYQGSVEDETGDAVGSITVNVRMVPEKSEVAAVPLVRLTDQKGTGRIRFDIRAGHLINSSMTQRLLLNVHPTNQPAYPVEVETSTELQMHLAPPPDDAVDEPSS